MFLSQNKNNSRLHAGIELTKFILDKIYAERKTAQVKKKDVRQRGGSRSLAMPEKTSYMPLVKSIRMTFGMEALSEIAVWFWKGKWYPAV